MATTKAVAQAKNNERVKVYIPKVPGQKVQDDVVLAVNGERIQIQRGVEVEVKRKFADALELFMRERDEAERIEFSLINDD